ncbi:MAG: DUF58 domain-containing protein [bacterium]
MSLLSPEFLGYLEKLDLLLRRSIRGVSIGERISSRHGRGIEFQDYRSYEIGDDFRYIDWNIYARLDRLFVKLFREEETVNIYIFLDISNSMDFGNPSKLFFGKEIAASLGYIGLVNYDIVNLYCISSEVEKRLEGLRGRINTIRLLRFLEDVSPKGITALNSVVRETVRALRGKAVFIVISDFLDPAGYQECLKMLRGKGYDVFVFHVLSEEEILPNIEEEVRLVDAETGETLELDSYEGIRDGYRKVLERFLNEIEDFSSRHNIEYVRASSSLPFERVIFYYLRLGGWVR